MPKRLCSKNSNQLPVLTDTFAVSKFDYDVMVRYQNLTAVMEYPSTVLVLEYHFLSTRTRNPRYSVGTRTRRSMYSVLSQKKRRVHEYIWPLLKVTNKMNF